MREPDGPGAPCEASPPTQLEEAEAAFHKAVSDSDTARETDRDAREHLRRMDAMFQGVIKATRPHPAR